jgi:hypothetical protein
MKLLGGLAVCAVVSLLPGCRDTSGMVVGRGVVSGYGVECGAWFLRADSGRWYQLTRLAPEFQQSQLPVRFVLRPSDLANTCGFGEKVDVVSIAKFW